MKMWFLCVLMMNYICVQPVGLGKIAYLINAGKIDSHELITMKTLKVLFLVDIILFFKKNLAAQLCGKS